MFTKVFDALLRRRPSREAFARRFMAAARKAGVEGPLRYEADAFRIVSDFGTSNLDNVYQAYLQAPLGQRQAVLMRYIALVPQQDEGEQSWDEVREHLRAVIRHRGTFTESGLDAVLKDGWQAYREPVGRAWGEDCLELLAIDRPDSISTLTAGPPEAWNVSLDQALEIARDRLRDATPNAFKKFLPGVWRGDWNDGYDTSRALLPDVLHRAPMGGTPVFMLPARDALLIASASDLPALRSMARAALEIAREGRTVSAGLYTYDQREVVSFAHEDPEIGHWLGELRRDLDQESYAQQKCALDKINLAQGEDVFVATCARFMQGDASGPSGSESTYLLTTWTEGVATSLPKADRIAFVWLQGPREGATLVVGWDAAMPLVGNLLTLDRDLYPPRFRTAGFPSDEVIVRLEAIRID